MGLLLQRHVRRGKESKKKAIDLINNPSDPTQPSVTRGYSRRWQQVANKKLDQGITNSGGSGGNTEIVKEREQGMRYLKEVLDGTEARNQLWIVWDRHLRLSFVLTVLSVLCCCCNFLVIAVMVDSQLKNLFVPHSFLVNIYQCSIGVCLWYLCLFKHYLFLLGSIIISLHYFIRIRISILVFQLDQDFTF